MACMVASEIRSLFVGIYSKNYRVLGYETTSPRKVQVCNQKLGRLA